MVTGSQVEKEHYVRLLQIILSRFQEKDYVNIGTKELRFLDLGAGPGGFSECLLNFQSSSTGIRVVGGHGVTLPPEEGGVRLRPPQGANSNNYTYEYANLMNVKQHPLRCTNAHILTADCQYIDNTIRTAEPHLAQWVLLLQQFLVGLDKLEESGLFVFRLELTSGCDRNISILDREVDFQLTFWSLQAVFSLFRGVEPHIGGDKSSIHVLCHGFKAENFRTEQWPRRLSAAIRAIRQMSENEILMDFSEAGRPRNSSVWRLTSTGISRRFNVEKFLNFVFYRNARSPDGSSQTIKDNIHFPSLPTPPVPTCENTSARTSSSGPVRAGSNGPGNRPVAISNPNVVESTAPNTNGNTSTTPPGNGSKPLIRRSSTERKGPMAGKENQDVSQVRKSAFDRKNNGESLSERIQKLRERSQSRERERQNYLQERSTNVEQGRGLQQTPIEQRQKNTTPVFQPQTKTGVYGQQTGVNVSFTGARRPSVERRERQSMATPQNLAQVTPLAPANNNSSILSSRNASKESILSSKRERSGEKRLSNGIDDTRPSSGANILATQGRLASPLLNNNQFRTRPASPNLQGRPPMGLNPKADISRDESPSKYGTHLIREGSVERFRRAIEERKLGRSDSPQNRNPIEQQSFGTDKLFADSFLKEEEAQLAAQQASQGAQAKGDNPVDEALKGGLLAVLNGGKPIPGQANLRPTSANTSIDTGVPERQSSKESDGNKRKHGISMMQVPTEVPAEKAIQPVNNTVDLMECFASPVAIPCEKQISMKDIEPFNFEKSMQSSSSSSQPADNLDEALKGSEKQLKENQSQNESSQARSNSKGSNSGNEQQEGISWSADVSASASSSESKSATTAETVFDSGSASGSISQEASGSAGSASSTSKSSSLLEGEPVPRSARASCTRCLCRKVWQLAMFSILMSTLSYVLLVHVVSLEIFEKSQGPPKGAGFLYEMDDINNATVQKDTSDDVIEGIPSPAQGRVSRTLQIASRPDFIQLTKLNPFSREFPIRSEKLFKMLKFLETKAATAQGRLEPQMVKFREALGPKVATVKEKAVVVWEVVSEKIEEVGIVARKGLKKLLQMISEKVSSETWNELEKSAREWHDEIWVKIEEAQKWANEDGVLLLQEWMGKLLDVLIYMSTEIAEYVGKLSDWGSNYFGEYVEV